MYRFNIKNIILGIGIGIIISSMLNMVYLAGAKPGRMLTDEEIKRRALELGMVKAGSLLDSYGEDADTGDNDETGNTQKNTGAQETKPAAANNPPKNKQPEPAASTKKIVVRSGETSVSVSKKLEAAGLINDTDAFNKEMVALKLAGSIKIGEHDIPERTETREIIRLLTGK